jgi:hypothetical protein
MKADNGFVIKLTQDAPLNLDSLFEKLKASGVFVSYSPENHAVEMPDIRDKALFISFPDGNLNTHDGIMFYDLVYKVADKFGVNLHDQKTGAQLPTLYFEQDEWSFMVKSSKWTEVHDECYLVEKSTGRVIDDDDEDDSIHEKAEIDEAAYDNYAFYDYTEVVDVTKYPHPEPSFFLTALFWKNRKEKYEAAAKQAFKDSENVWRQLRY